MTQESKHPSQKQQPTIAGTSVSVSIYDLAPVEKGGEEARKGFSFQDHIAAGFFLDMLLEEDLLEVWCEVHDDITLVWKNTAQAQEETTGQHPLHQSAAGDSPGDSSSVISSPVRVEFVQVKRNELPQLWTVAELCKKEKTREVTAITSETASANPGEEPNPGRAKQKQNTQPPKSILEKSLEQARCSEPCQFRLVTLRDIHPKLAILKESRGSERSKKKEMDWVRGELAKYADLAFKSERGHDITFWVENFLWQVESSEANIILKNKEKIRNIIEEKFSSANIREKDINDIYHFIYSQASATAKAQKTVDKKVTQHRFSMQLAHYMTIMVGVAAQRGLQISQNLEEALTNYLKKGFKDDTFSGQEAGEIEEAPIPLPKIFIDLDVVQRADLSEVTGLNKPPESSKPTMKPQSALNLLIQKGNLSPAHEGYINSNGTRSTKKLLLIGGPGQGKSTLGQQLAQLHRANFLKLPYSNQSELEELGEARIVFRVILRDFAQWLADNRTRNSLIVYLAEQLRKPAISPQEIDETSIYQLLKFYHSLLILDGLDEVTEPRLQDKVLGAITELLGWADTSALDMQTLVTTRPLSVASGLSGYFQLLDLEEFAILELQKIAPNKAKEYAQKWVTFQTIKEEKRQQILAIFNSNLQNPTTATLLATPLQVTIMLQLIKEGGVLPTQREELFDKYWDKTLRREKSKGTTANIVIEEEGGQLFNLHCFLGYIIHNRAAASQVDAQLHEDDFRELVGQFLRRFDNVSSDAEIGLRVDRLGRETGERIVLITKPGQGYFAFELRSFQEFFAAAYICQQATSLDRALAVLKKLVGHDHWRNVVFLAIARLVRQHTNLEELRDFLDQLFEFLDIPTGVGLLKPGSWLALELASDNIFRGARTLQKFALEYGLGVLETNYNFKNPLDLTNLLRAFPNSDKAKIILPFIEKKLPTIVEAYVYQSLEVYWGISLPYRQSKAEMEMEKLRKTIQDNLATIKQTKKIEFPRILRFTFETKLEPSWIGSLLKEFWPEWNSLVLDWWQTYLSNLEESDYDYNYEEDVEDWESDDETAEFADAQLAHSGNSKLEYFEKIIRSWSTELGLIEIVAKQIVRDIRFLSADYFPSFNIVKLDSSTQPTRLLLTLLNASELLAKPTTGSGETLYEDEVFDIDYSTPDLQRYDFNESALWRLLKNSEILPEVQAVLWVVVWTRTTPTQESYSLFLNFLVRIKTNLELRLFLIRYLRKSWWLLALIAETAFGEINVFSAVVEKFGLLKFSAFENLQREITHQLEAAIVQKLTGLNQEMEEHTSWPINLMLLENVEALNEIAETSGLSQLYDFQNLLPTIQIVAGFLRVYKLKRQVRQIEKTVYSAPITFPVSYLAQSLRKINTTSDGVIERHFLTIKFLALVTEFLDLPILQEFAALLVNEFRNYSNQDLETQGKKDLIVFYTNLELWLVVNLLSIYNKDAETSSEVFDILFESLCTRLVEPGNFDFTRGADLVSYVAYHIKYSSLVTKCSNKLGDYFLSENLIIRKGAVILYRIFIDIYDMSSGLFYITYHDVPYRPPILFEKPGIFLLAKELSYSDNLNLRLAGINLLAYCSESIVDKQYQERLLDRLSSLEKISTPGEREAWLKHLYLVIANNSSAPENLIGILESILKNPRLYSYPVLKVAAYGISKLQKVESISLSTQEAKELGLL